MAADGSSWTGARLGQLDELLRRHDYRGWDPFDLPNAPLFAATVGDEFWMPQLILSKMGARLIPDSGRRLLRVPEIEDPKIYACAYFGYRGRDAGRAREMIDRLAALAVRTGEGGAYWGYDYTWATRTGEVNPRGASTIVPGSFALFALLDHQATGGGSHRELIAAAADHYRTHHLSVGGSGEFLGYFAGAQVNTHNANLLGCAALTLGGRALERDDLLADAARAADTSVRAVEATGYLPYADHPSANWTDCFHHLYVMACVSLLERLNPHVDRAKFQDALARLRTYLRTVFIRADGLLNYYPGRLHPIDPHNYAAAAIYAIAFGTPDDLPPDSAEPLLREVDARMWNARKGRYRFRRHRLRRDSRLFLRWTQAWMFAALSVVDQEQARSRSSSESTRNLVAQFGN